LDSSSLGDGTPAINYLLTLPFIPTILNVSVLSRLTPKPISWMRAENFLGFTHNFNKVAGSHLPLFKGFVKIRECEKDKGD
jgi:hypothetical protein